MICVIFFLPLSIAPGWDRPPAVGEELWLIGLYTASIGLPFFALSANAPLLQAWFVRSGHPAAKDPYFLYAGSNVGSFLQKCGADVTITQADARRTLADAPDGAYDPIVVDAYSSDAIPVHLLTREAMAIYLKKPSSRGIIVMHVTNRHLELASVVAGIATANGFITRVNDENTTISKTASVPAR